MTWHSSCREALARAQVFQTNARSDFYESLLKEFKIVKELRGPQFRLLRVDVKLRELKELSRMSQEKVDKDKEKLERMMQYGQSAMCRWRLLHDYLGEEMEAERCGNCDNCVHPLEEQIAPPDRRAAASF